ncbi:MAG: CHASE domain-containing protein [bacterium]
MLLFLKQDNKQIILAFAILILGLLVTFVISMTVKTSVEKYAKNEFYFVCKEINNKISTRLHNHAQLLRSQSVLFIIKENITRSEWRNIYTKQLIEKNLPGIQGVGYAVLIRPGQLAEHEKKIREEGFSDYFVYPKGKREIYSAIVFLEPFTERNLRAFGYDMFSEPIRRKAMEKARDSNIASLTGKITLVQETNSDVQTGTLMYIPIYQNGKPINTIKERRDALRGWVYSPYRMDDLMKGILGGYESFRGKNVSLEIYDDAGYNKNTILYNSKKMIKKQIKLSSEFEFKTSISFNGQYWYLKYNSISLNFDYSKVWYSAFSGTIVSFLLFILYLSLIATAKKANRLVLLTAELSDSEERYRKAQQVGHVGSWEYNIKNSTFWGSDEGKRIYGFNLITDIFTSEEVMNCVIEKERVNKALIDLIEKNKPYNLEFEIVRYKSSERRIISSIAELIKDKNGEPLKVTGVLQDITERKQAERMFLDIIDKNPLSIQVVDKNGFTLHVNSAHTKLFGTFPPPDYSIFNDFQVKEQGFGELFEQVKKGEVVYFPDLFYNAHNLNPKFPDIPVWISMVVFPLNDSTGKPERFVLIHENITERKKSELIIMQQNIQLQELNAAKNKFFSIIAHDLKSPFQGFLGLTEMMIEETSSFSKEELSSIGKDMHESATNLYKLLQNLLEWSQIQKGTITFNPTNLNLNLIVSRNIEIINQRAIQKEITIVNKINDKINIIADEKMADAVLRNLLSNAVKFTKKNGNVIISVKEIENQFIEISITDNGIGMSEDLCNNLFRIDEKVGRTRTDGEISSGLGLLLCKEFVEKNGGKIWVNSEEGKGSTFYFTFPKQN